MGVTFRKCMPDHLRYIAVQELQRHDQAAMLTSEYAETATAHLALSAWVGNKCLGAAGIIPVTRYRAVAWALVSERVGPYMVPITRKLRQVIAQDPTPRIEMTVAVDFKPGHVWARLVGMTLETPEPLRRFGARGEDEMLYARIRS